MSADNPKLSSLAPDGSFQEHRHAHVFWREPTTGPERLVVAPRGEHVSLVSALASCLHEPMFLIYELLVSQVGNAEGRYQSKELTLTECQALLRRHAAFFEQDGRHNVWVGNRAATIVYDQHQLVYAYGPLDAFEGVCRAAGCEPGHAAIPSPHSHHYHSTFAATEEALLAERAWIFTPDTN